MYEDEEETVEEKKLYERVTTRILSSSYIQSLKGRLLGEKKVAVFVDGPNFLRKVNNRQIKLEEVDEIVKSLGRVTVKKVMLNEFASENLIQAVTNNGYEPVVSPYDIYISLSIEVMKLLNKEKKINVIAIASRHARVGPILLKIKEKGIESCIIGFEPGMSIALKKTANQFFEIRK
ncbi:MAG: NYN domain-containing protein [Candidatus Heimdallarchaeaceae archaeon]